MGDLSKDDVKAACMDAIKEYENTKTQKLTLIDQINILLMFIFHPKGIDQKYKLKDNSIDSLLMFFLELSLDAIGYGIRFITFIFCMQYTGLQPNHYAVFKLSNSVKNMELLKEYQIKHM